MTDKQNSLAGYKYLLTYQYSLVIYDLTVEFCAVFLSGRELLKQRDQMVQAARSGKQNIVEGYEGYGGVDPSHSPIPPHPSSSRASCQPYGYALSTHNLSSGKTDKITQA